MGAACVGLLVIILFQLAPILVPTRSNILYLPALQWAAANNSTWAQLQGECAVSTMLFHQLHGACFVIKQIILDVARCLRGSTIGVAWRRKDQSIQFNCYLFVCMKNCLIWHVELYYALQHLVSFFVFFLTTFCLRAVLWCDVRIESGNSSLCTCCGMRYL